MQVYSKVILSFIQRLYNYAEEMLLARGIKCKNKKIYRRDYIYNLSIIVFDSVNKLGYFSNYEIGINKNLMYYDTDKIKNILGHELAHFLTWIYYGDTSHGPNFTNICKQYNFLDSKPASMHLDSSQNVEPIVIKIQKLLSLAGSSNKNEAELATSKANQLLLKHNLDMMNLDNPSEELVSIKILNSHSKRRTGKISAIANIVNTFMVRTFYAYENDSLCLEIFGAIHNVKIGEFVANFLDKKLDELWREYSTRYYLKGIRAKNSFMIGIGEGFIDTIAKNRIGIDEKSLIVLETKLDSDLKYYFPHLRNSTGLTISNRSFNYGHSVGRNLKISTPVEKSSETTTYLLTP